MHRESRQNTEKNALSMNDTNRNTFSICTLALSVHIVIFVAVAAFRAKVHTCTFWLWNRFCFFFVEFHWNASLRRSCCDFMQKTRALVIGKLLFSSLVREIKLVPPNPHRCIRLWRFVSFFFSEFRLGSISASIGVCMCMNTCAPIVQCTRNNNKHGGNAIQT